ncbi:MAG: tetratricopeptide repeat protein [Verrucomicrobia bacterium]|nr:tetratricopeptide repeat protein [Verrucomicrobiota bacterium]
MLYDEFGENRIAAWFRGLTMTARIQIVLFSLLGVLLAIGAGIALIEQPAILLPTEGPDAKPVPGEPTNRPAAPNEAKIWRRAEGLMAQGAGAAVSVESKGEIEAMRKLVNLKPEDADSWDRLGKSLYLAGIELSPGNRETLANLGVTLKTKGDLTDYEKVVDELAKVDAKMARELMDFSPKKMTTIMASKPATGGTSATAPAALPAPSLRVPDSIPGVRAKANEQQRGEIDALRKLVAMDEKDADNWDRLGKGLFLAENYDEAVKCFHKSLELKPGVQEDMAQYQQVLDQLTALNPKMGEDLKNFTVPNRPANP